MHAQGTSLTPQLDPFFGVVVADGYGIKIHVRHGQLVIDDGFGNERRHRTLARATSRLRRLVLLGHTGYITLEAIRWLEGIGATLVQIEKDGRLLLTSSVSGRDHAGLRRAQALAASNQTGFGIAQDLLLRKLRGQAEVLREVAEDSSSVSEVERLTDRAWSSTTINEILAVEAVSAKAYWEAVAELPVRFPRAELAKIPEHWLSFGGRRSPVGGRNRNAANPANAMLNYLYRLAEAEMTVALITLGLDPGIGIWHVDEAGRDSLALDALEAIRPAIDRHLFQILVRRTFSRGDFHETREGVCRTLAPLTHELAQAMPMLGRWVAPIVESVAKRIGESANPPVLVGTRLTRDGLSLSKDRLRRSTRTEPRVRPPQGLWRCRMCGARLDDPYRAYCDDCLPEYDGERTRRLKDAGTAALERMRSSAADPAQSEAARAKRAEKSRRTTLAIRAWEREHGRSSDHVRYRAEILPVIEAMRVADLARITGLSKYFCRQVQRGDRVLHEIHWDKLVPPRS